MPKLRFSRMHAPWASIQMQAPRANIDPASAGLGILHTKSPRLLHVGLSPPNILFAPPMHIGGQNTGWRIEKQCHPSLTVFANIEKAILVGQSRHSIPNERDYQDIGFELAPSSLAGLTGTSFGHTIPCWVLVIPLLGYLF